MSIPLPLEENKDDDTHPSIFEPRMVAIPAGPFLMGSSADNPLATPPEQPQHQVELPTYYISKYPITNLEYWIFIRQTGFAPPRHWDSDHYPSEKEMHPVVYVSGGVAMADCVWLRGLSGKPYRLPSEAEWEKAARGTAGRSYPWGDTPSPVKWKTAGQTTQTRPVGAYSPETDSPYGLVDMSGHIWEWTLSLWGTTLDEPDFKYPYNPDDGREDIAAKGMRILRGGPLNDENRVVRCTVRVKNLPLSRFKNYGFRVGFY
jgi:serine/threonine-protein kinase